MPLVRGFGMLDASGASPVSLFVEDMRQLLKILLLMIVLGAGDRSTWTTTQAATLPPILQVGLVMDSATADSIQMEFPQSDRGGTNKDRILNLLLVPALNETNLEREMQVWQRGDAVAAEVRFKGGARQQWAELTRTNIGKDIAIIIDGKVFGTMVIGNGVSDGRFLINAKWSLKDAQALCSRLEVTRGRKR